MCHGPGCGAAGRRQHLAGPSRGAQRVSPSPPSDYQVAIDAAGEGLKLGLDLRDAYHYLSCQFHQGWALLHQGDLGEAMAVLVDGLQMAERNGNRTWARVFRFAMAWVHEHAFDFEGARALCEHARDEAGEPILGQFLGLIVLGIACLGLGQHDPALRAFDQVTVRVEEGHILMDWILRMPLQRGLSECSACPGRSGSGAPRSPGARRPGRPPARAHVPGVEPANAGGHRPSRRAARPTRSPELARGLAALDGADAPLAGWRIHASAATIHARRKHAVQANRHRARSAAILTRLADSLRDWPGLQRSLLAAPRVQAVLH